MELKELIISLCGIPSISGRERMGEDELDALIGDVFDEHRSDAVGNQLFIKRCGKPNAPKILVDTHFDEIGMMVTGIKEGGFVSVTNLGGVDARVLPSGEVILYGKEPVYGVFAAKAPHLTPPSEWGTHALVGSCAQVGKHVHLSAASQLGGVLEPVGALPVIIEDNVFIGGNCGIYEGTIVKENAVIGTGVIINASTAIFDATTGEYIRANENGQMVVPAGAVVVAGSRPISKGPGAEQGIHLYCPVIVKYRDEKTAGSITLEDMLR